MTAQFNSFVFPNDSLMTAFYDPSFGKRFHSLSPRDQTEHARSIIRPWLGLLLASMMVKKQTWWPVDATVCLAPCSQGSTHKRHQYESTILGPSFYFSLEQQSKCGCPCCGVDRRDHSGSQWLFLLTQWMRRGSSLLLDCTLYLPLLVGKRKRESLCCCNSRGPSTQCRGQWVWSLSYW